MQKKHINIIILCAILFLSIFLNLWNNNFGLLHIDEGFKIGIITGENKHDFHHPMLIMQAVRIPNAVLKYTKKLEVVRLARTTTAVWGTLSVLFIFLIARTILPNLYSLLIAAGVAISPIMVIHSHYLKEDMIFCCFALFSLWRYVLYVRDHSRLNALWLGIATGLVLSSQYKAVLLVVMYLCLTILLSGIQYKRYYLNFAIITIPLSIVVFLIANYPLFFDFEHFKAGLTFSTTHAIKGHSLKIYPLDHLFLFHFRYSLIPGLTAGVAFLGAAAMLWALFYWKKMTNTEKILLVYAIIFYVAVEMTPLKAFPAFIRYVVPVAPIMILFMFRRFAVILEKYPKGLIRITTMIVIGIIFVWPLHDTIKLTHYMNKDTRDEAQEWMKKSPHKVMCEQYVWPYAIVKRLGDRSVSEWQSVGFQYLVASSFMYERYLFGLTLKNQDPETYEIGKRYEELFTYPYEEIRPKFKSFAFSNPVIRIIDIRKK